MKRGLIIVLIFFTLFSSISAQELDQFEDAFQENPDDGGDNSDAWEDEEDDYDEYDEYDDEDNGFSALLMELFVRLVMFAVVYGGANSQNRMHPTFTGTADDFYVRPRAPGETLIPVFRSDTTFGMIESELFCADQRLEAGYGAVGLSGRYSYFFETDNDSGIHLWEAFIHYRMSMGDFMEISPGIGAFGMEGKNDYDGFSMAFPVRMHAPGRLSLEFLTAWNFYPSGAVGTDLDLGLMFDLGYIYPKAGYRRYGTKGLNLDVFYLGCTVSY